jgi:hypothetical protein
MSGMSNLGWTYSLSSLYIRGASAGRDAFRIRFQSPAGALILAAGPRARRAYG